MQPVKDRVEHEALGHAHDAQLVLLAEPDDEAAVGRLVAAPPARPVRRDAGRGEVWVGGHVFEHHVRGHKFLVLVRRDEVRVLRIACHLLPHIVGRHAVHVAAVSWVGLEHVEGLEHRLLKVDAVRLCHQARQREGGQVAPDAHAHREFLAQPELLQVELTVSREALDAFERPVRLVDLAAAVVVALADAVKEGREVVVVGRVDGVAAEARVVVVEARLCAQGKLVELGCGQRRHPRLHLGLEQRLCAQVVGVGLVCHLGLRRELSDRRRHIVLPVTD
mmetsp:Transcript_11141/g.33310  ORF Transcript_11141/g.33310 Transcript_11141/m.33310 type:complete len:278 (-) Transcript_11141:22-855(-)